MTVMKFKDGSSLRFLSLAADILNVATASTDSAKVMDVCKRHLPATSAQEYLAKLSQLGLLDYDKRKDSFTTTRKGKSFLNDYERLRAQL